MTTGHLLPAGPPQLKGWPLHKPPSKQNMSHKDKSTTDVLADGLRVLFLWRNHGSCIKCYMDAL